MDSLVFFAVLGAAALHAGWNTVVKTGLDRFSAMLLFSAIQAAISIALLPFFAFPDREAWPWLAVSAFLHAGYKLFLVRAYDHGDLSQVYPLARGTAPLVVALVGIALLGEAMTATKTLAVAVIGLGIVLISFAGRPGAASLSGKGLVYGLVTAAFIAAYTLVDGLGARLSGSASGYTLVMFAGDGLIMLAVAVAVHGRATVAKLLPTWRSGLLAGSMSLGSYWIVIWAFTAAPIPLVAALRETSVLFAMAFAAAFLGERPGRRRWAAAALIVSGVALIRP